MQFTTGADSPLTEDNEFKMTPEQLSEYEEGLSDPCLVHVREALDGYLHGTNNQENGESLYAPTVVDSLDDFKDYLKSRFVLLKAEPSVFGGKVFSIVFQDKPDKLFGAWVYKLSGGSYDLRGFWQNRDFDEDAMETILKVYKILQLPAV